MSAEATQIRCPFCNGPQEPRPSSAYTCEFCLQPFSVQDAAREEARLAEEIKAWVEQRVGAASAGAGVDAASRAFIFQQKVLPDLRREVDRALERVGAYGQFPLLTVPVRTPLTVTHGANPLLANRREILALKGLRARLASDDVTAFAARDADRLAVQAMDRHLASLTHLSNVAEAAATHTVEGYAAARRNLEALGAEVARSIATEGAADPALGQFLDALQVRFAALAQICRTCEEAGSPNVVAGAPLAERLEGLATSLGEAAHRVEAGSFAPADAMPVVVALHQEAGAARALGRWLRAYDRIAGRSQVSFGHFVADLDPLTGGGSVPPDGQLELLDTIALVLDVARGGATLPVVDDFSWVEPWCEAGRKQKSLGMFGVEERIEGVERFFAPVWVADVGYSRAQGAVFTSGQSLSAVVALDASAPWAQRVAVLGEPFAAALSQPKSARSSPVAMPRSSAAQASVFIVQALRLRPDMLSPRVRVRGLALVAAARVTYASGAGQRAVTACAGQVPLDNAAAAHVHITQQMLSRYG